MIVEKYGVQRGSKYLEEARRPYGGCAFRGISKMDGGFSPTMYPSRLGMVLAFFFARYFLRRCRSQDFIPRSFFDSLRQGSLAVGLLEFL